METIGLRISTYRNSRRWTQRRLAAEVGITQSMLSEIENDRVSPKWDVLMKIAERLELPILSLLPLSADTWLSQADHPAAAQHRNPEEPWHLWEALLKAKEELLKSKDETIEILKNRQTK